MISSLRPLALTVAAIALVGCGEKAPPFEPVDPTTCSVYAYSPGDGQMSTWPSMDYLEEDETTVTGYRFNITTDTYRVLHNYANFATIATDGLRQLDGFGINAAFWAEFSGTIDPAKLPAADGKARASDPIGVIVFDEDENAELWPVELRASENTETGGTLVSAFPLRPLPDKSRAAFFITSALGEAADTGCASRSEAMHELLYSGDKWMKRSRSALEDLGVVESVDEIVTLQPFITQSIYEESEAIARDIASRPDSDFELKLDRDEDCQPDPATPEYIWCVAKLEITDYRNAERFVELDKDGNAIRQSTYTSNVHIWIPETQLPEPAPAILFGHGLTGASTGHAREVLEFTIDQGVVVVGIDAMEHGDHPLRVPGEMDVMSFFAIEFDEYDQATIDSLRLRDNFRQSTYDKLQVTRAILASPDLNGDGKVDIDTSKMSYIGVSLGAIMGSELLALTDAYQSGVLSMPGGSVSSIVNNPVSVFRPLIFALLPDYLQLNPAEIEKTFSVLQVVLDRGDAASYGKRILENRIISDSNIPDVAVHVALGDDTVPNRENYTFARSMGIGILEPVRGEALGLDSLGSDTVSGNVADGKATAGVVQFDQIQRHEGGPAVDVGHGSLPSSVQSIEAIFHFVETRWNGGLGELMDPYILAPLPD